LNAVAFRHAFARRWKAAVLLGLGMGAFQYVVLLTSSSFFSVSEDALPPLIANPPRAIRAFLGGATNLISPDGWIASAMLHPIALSLASISALLVPAASGVAELERGTLDLVLARPVGRRSYLSARLGAGLMLMAVAHALMLLGMLLGWSTLEGVKALTLQQILIAWLGATMIFAFFSAAGAWIFVSSSQRGRAMGWTVALIVGSFLANFLSLAFDATEFLGPITPFRYFRVPVLLDGGPWVQHYLVLAAGTLLCAVGALWSFSRRDLTR
jgi:ABC-2 type transport system permease protein